MNNKILPFIFLLFLALISKGQNYKFVYYLDKDLNSTKKDDALIIGKGYKKDEAFILDCFLRSSGRKTVSATLKDSSLSTLHGLFTSYSEDMKIASEGNYFENDLDGVWKYWDEHGLITDSVFYSHGIRLAYGTYKYYFLQPTLKQLIFNPNLKDTLNRYKYSFTDSLKNTFIEKEVGIKDGKEKIMFQADFVGNRGLLKEYDSLGGVKSDSVFSRNQKEADFIGGENAWRDFLRHTLNAAVPTDNKAPSGKYMVMVKFIVNENGIVTDIVPENNPGYGTVAEVIRVIKASGRWAPAIRYGRPVKAYRRQPVTFLVEGE